MRTLQWVIILLLAFGHAQPDNLRLVITVEGDLVSIDTQGQDQRLLVRNRCSNRAQSVLADGYSLAFFAGGRKCTMYGMNRLDLNSGEVTRLAPIYGIVSPDGRSVAEKRVLYHSRTGPYEIYVWDVATWAERKVGEGRVAFVDDVDMVWSPDSRYLAYEVGYLMEMQGWRVVDLDTGAVFRLSGFLPPLWTPDGRFVYLSDRLYRDSMRGMRDVSWSADNRHFTYLSWTSRFEAIRIDTTAVWISDSQTGNAWQVHPRTQNGGQPAGARE
jgi:tricorn protease-like protein